MGREVVVAITKGKLDFGPWEQIFYGEFDGNRNKTGADQGDWGLGMRESSQVCQWPALSRAYRAPATRPHSNPARPLARMKISQAGGGDHRRVVGRKRNVRDVGGNAAPLCRGRRSPCGGARSPTRHRQSQRSAHRIDRPPRTGDPAGSITTTRWKLAQMSSISLSLERHSAFRALPHVAQDGRLQAAEAEIQIPFHLRRIPIGVSHARRWKRDRLVVAVARALVHDRPARVAQPEQLRDLVVGLPRRIIAGSSDALVVSRLCHDIQARVPARDNQRDERQRDLAMLKEQGLDVAGEVMHRQRAGDRARARATWRTTRRPAAIPRARAPASRRSRRDASGRS